MDYSNIISTGVYTSSINTTSSNTVNFVYIIERCRACKHAHSQKGGTGCYDVVGASVAFVICQCKEHVPEDNLEYLEYILNKKESL
jgi:hypothetical protein